MCCVGDDDENKIEFFNEIIWWVHASCIKPKLSFCAPRLNFSNEIQMKDSTRIGCFKAFLSSFSLALILHNIAYTRPKKEWNKTNTKIQVNFWHYN